LKEPVPGAVYRFDRSAVRISGSRPVLGADDRVSEGAVHHHRRLGRRQMVDGAGAAQDRDQVGAEVGHVGGRAALVEGGAPVAARQVGARHRPDQQAVEQRPAQAIELPVARESGSVRAAVPAAADLADDERQPAGDHRRRVRHEKRKGRRGRGQGTLLARTWE
jgi:hypothetical protein